MIVRACVVVVVGLSVVGGLFAFRSLEAEPAPKIPHPERIVQVDVQPER